MNNNKKEAAIVTVTLHKCAVSLFSLTPDASAKRNSNAQSVGQLDGPIRIRVIYFDAVTREKTNL